MRESCDSGELRPVPIALSVAGTRIAALPASRGRCVGETEFPYTGSFVLLGDMAERPRGIKKDKTDQT